MFKHRISGRGADRRLTTWSPPQLLQILTAEEEDDCVEVRCYSRGPPTSKTSLLLVHF
jgi:hypothetical protein